MIQTLYQNNCNSIPRLNFSLQGGILYFYIQFLFVCFPDGASNSGTSVSPFRVGKGKNIFILYILAQKRRKKFRREKCNKKILFVS